MLQRQPPLPLLLLLSSLAALCSAQPSRVLPPPSGPLLQPYPYLSGGNFSSPSLQPFTPDPLGHYVWAPGADVAQLQVFYLLPAAAELTAGTGPGSFAGLESLLQPAQNITVSGPGGLHLDSGVTNAAWL